MNFRSKPISCRWACTIRVRTCGTFKRKLEASLCRKLQLKRWQMQTARGLCLLRIRRRWTNQKRFRQKTQMETDQVSFHELHFQGQTCALMMFEAVPKDWDHLHQRGRVRGVGGMKSKAGNSRKSRPAHAREMLRICIFMDAIGPTELMTL